MQHAALSDEPTCHCIHVCSGVVTNANSFDMEQIPCTNMLMLMHLFDWMGSHIVTRVRSCASRSDADADNSISTEFELSGARRGRSIDFKL